MLLSRIEWSNFSDKAGCLQPLIMHFPNYNKGKGYFVDVSYRVVRIPKRVNTARRFMQRLVLICLCYFIIMSQLKH